MKIEKSKVLIQFLVFFRQFGDVLSFLYARKLRGYTATLPLFVRGHCHGHSFPVLLELVSSCREGEGRKLKR